MGRKPRRNRSNGRPSVQERTRARELARLKMNFAALKELVAEEGVRQAHERQKVRRKEQHDRLEALQARHHGRVPVPVLIAHRGERLEGVIAG